MSPLLIISRTKVSELSASEGFTSQNDCQFWAVHRRHRLPNAAAAPHRQHAVQGARNTLTNNDLPLAENPRVDVTRVDACMFVKVFLEKLA